MIKQVSFLAALLFSSMANAGFYSGSGLLEESSGYVKNKSGEATVAEALNGGMFMGYVAGVFDTYSMQGNRGSRDEHRRSRRRGDAVFERAS